MATRVWKPIHVTQRAFLRKRLPQQWGVNFSRLHNKISIGKLNIDHSELSEWISEQPGFFYQSEGGSLFYFSDPNAALMFKMRFSVVE